MESDSLEAAQSIAHQWAGVFDDLVPALATDDPVVHKLRELADDGRVLEFGIGTGRIALPLARQGVRVEGIDISQEMVARLREKDPENTVVVTVGDFTTARVGSDFSLVYMVLNTFEGLASRNLQRMALQNAAEHLAPGGRLALESFAPHGLFRHSGRGILNVDEVSLHDVRASYMIHEPLSQVLRLQLVYMKTDKVTLLPGLLRYVWPSELDLMAEAASLQLEHRWGDWAGGSFDESALQYMSVFRKSGR